MNWLVFITCFILTITLIRLRKGHKKHISPTRTEAQKQTDELISVILPTINERE